MLKEILIVGSGAREDALASKLEASERKLYIAPGNAGTSARGTNIPLQETDIAGLTNFAKKHHIGLTVVGPESALEAGIVDAFTAENLAIFGPTKAAAQLETSKAWAIEFMKRHHIPHPDSQVFSDVEEARSFVKNTPWPLVIKVDGLANGKGVVLPETIKDAQLALEDMMVHKKFGEAGSTVVIQRRMQGPEVSIFALSDGKTIVPLLPAQDHKRLKDGDRGPNTGGMGAYTPVPFISRTDMQLIQQRILQPTIDGMRSDGVPFVGVLFAGLMITDRGPVVLEYNVRFGDPETQPLMRLFKGDLASVLASCTDGTLRSDAVAFQDGAAVGVVLAADGYPESPRKGDGIEGLKDTYADGVEVFHAGTHNDTAKNTVTNGGRILTVTAVGANIQEAATKAYEAIGNRGVHFADMQYRTDIGNKQ
jgi:phosphoribosylamine--glycine ligase